MYFTLTTLCHNLLSHSNITLSGSASIHVRVEDYNMHKEYMYIKGWFEVKRS